jgi:integrase
LSLVEEAWLREAIVFAVSTGIRRGELINLHWSDVDLDRKMMTIQSSGDFTVKGDKTRIVPLSAVAMAVIAQREKHLGCPYVFHRGGNRLWPNWVTELFRFYVKKAGLWEKGLHWHNLRSSFASWLVADGASIYAVSKLLGHSSVTLTQKYYARLAPETLHSTVDKIRIDFRKN